MELVTNADDWYLTLHPWSFMKCNLELFAEGKNGEVFIHQHLSPH